MTLVLTEPLPPYTCPIELLTFQPTPNDIKTVFKNGDYERKIYNNIELDEDEREAIAALRKLQRTAEIKLSRSMQCRILRFLSHTRNNEGKALQCLLLTQEWRKTQFRRPLVDTALRDKLKFGFSYFCGRDSGMRPMLFVRCKMAFATGKSMDVACVINIFTFCMEYAMRYLFIPGKVECLNVVIDVDGMTLLQYKDDRVRQLIHVLTKHYVGQLYKMFVINAPIWIGSLWCVFKSILSDRQRAKTVFVSKPSQVCSDAGCARHQIEERYGGSKPDLTEYYPFSFSPGPFTAGYGGIPNTNSPKDAHRCINRVTSVGMLAEDGAPKPLQWSSRGRDILMSLGMWAPERNEGAVNRVSPTKCSQRSDFSDTEDTDEETEFFVENPLKQRGRDNNDDDTKNIQKRLKCTPSEESTVEGDEEKEHKATDNATDNATDAGPRTPSSPSKKNRINPMGPRQVTDAVACCDAASPVLVVTSPGHKRPKKVSIDSLSASTEITMGTKKSEEEQKDGEEDEEDDEEESFSDNNNYAKSDDQESLLSDLLAQETDGGQEALERLRLAMLEKKPKSQSRTLAEVLAEAFFFSSWVHSCCGGPSQKSTSVDVRLELQVGKVETTIYDDS